MTLTPVPLPLPPHLRAGGLAPGFAEGGNQPGLLMPLLPATLEGRQRLVVLLRAMATDMLARVFLHK